MKAMISEDVTKGVVHIPHGWSPKQFIEGHLQNLILPLCDPETTDKTREIRYNLNQDRMGIYGYPETVFIDVDVTIDCLCEVKKAE